MEDMYVTPGNQERGWNDPPQFSYGLQVARGPQRKLLNKRAAPPVSAHPPCGGDPPPLQAACPPPGCRATLPPPAGPMRDQKEANSSQSAREPDVEVVVLVLKRALAVCRQTVKGQVCNDVGKRLCLLEDSWRSGRLSLPVRRRMDILAQELQSGHWDAADEIHRSLMVDHVTEVSQWMVGVKRLIAETRDLSPELLELFQNPAGPAQDSAGRVQDSAEPAQDSAGRVQDSAGPVQNSEGPVQDSAGPAQDSAGRVQDSAEPAQDSAEPAQDSAEPAQDSAGPVQNSVGPVQDSAEPAQDSAEPAQDSAGPVQDSAGPAQDLS